MEIVKKSKKRKTGEEEESHLNFIRTRALSTRKQVKILTRLESKLSTKSRLEDNRFLLKCLFYKRLPSFKLHLSSIMSLHMLTQNFSLAKCHTLCMETKLKEHKSKHTRRSVHENYHIPRFCSQRTWVCRVILKSLHGNLNNFNFFAFCFHTNDMPLSEDTSLSSKDS